MSITVGQATVNAMVSWDPDGPGPEGEWLVIGGNFDRAGSVAANDIAAFDGQAWRSLGSGTGSGEVNALTVWNGRLVAAGTFTAMNGVSAGRVAQFDGTTWSKFNIGSALDANATVNALAVYNGSLVMAGDFTLVGRGNSTVGINRVARWSGTQWEALSTGITGGPVAALAVYGDDLIAGGTFTNAGVVTASRIARWNATAGAWSAMNGGVNSNVNALAVFNDQLIVGGGFTTVGAAIPANRVAAWTAAGGWSAMGVGLGGTVYSLAVHAGELYAGGAFSTAGSGGTTIRYAARWDGAAWQQAAEGFQGAAVNALLSWGGRLHAGGSMLFDGGNIVCQGLGVLESGAVGWSPVTPSFTTIVFSFAEYQNRLYAGAWIPSAVGGPALGFARWDGKTWEAPTAFEMRNVVAMIEYNGELIVGGSFQTATGGPTDYIAAWNGSSWRTLGTGLNGAVRAMCIYRGDLIVGGSFTNAGGVPVNLIAKWNGAAWSALGTGMTEDYSPSGASRTVRALAVHNDRLVAGGVFLKAGGISVNHIAQWNGTAWSAMGGGFSGTVFTTVTGITVFNNEVVATGNAVWDSPTSPGTDDLHDIARWNGTNWLPLGAGFGGSSGNGSVGGFDLAVYNGSLYACGVFDAAGSVSAGHIARWDGSNWFALGTGTENTSYSDVRRLFPFRGELMVGGNFATTNGQPSGFFARWTTTNTPWVVAAGPVDRTVCPGAAASFDVTPATGYTAAIQWQQETAPGSGLYADLADGPAPGSPQSIIVGATTTHLSITNIGPGLNNLRYRARVSNACSAVTQDAGRVLVTAAPVFESQPSSVSTCEGQAVTFSVSVSGDNNQYQWRFRGLEIIPEVNPSAATATLEIPVAMLEYAGDYDCMVANECGLTNVSDLATLSFCACLECPADFNQDGGIDGGDLDTFFGAWQAGSCDADVNADGGVDGADVDTFFAAWEAGGCG